jgi:phosphatidylserine decarboxylase
MIKIKRIKIHREGEAFLFYSFLAIVSILFFVWYIFNFSIIFWTSFVLLFCLYGVVVNFFQCPRRIFNSDTERVVVAPADGKVVVVEEVVEQDYFHDRRMMVSIFMSLFNVHANWFPVEGKVSLVKHFDGNYHKAWLPKASEENEHADVLLETSYGFSVLCRQIAGAVARRIVTYAKEGEDCYIDEHLGFIKFGSRVDLYLPLDTEILVKIGQKTIGNQTIIAKF